MSARNPRSHQGLQHSFGVTEVDVKQWEDRLSIAWTQLTGVPSTFAPSSHTHLEADITDLQSYLVSPLTTDGDVLFYNSGHQRLAKGSDTEVLTLASGVPTWAAPAGGYTDPLTTDGDILIRDTTTKRLAKGTDDQILTLASGLPVWAAAPAGVTDHGALTGLGDDDHDQYALIAGDTFTGGVILNVGADAASLLTLGEVSTLRGNAQDGRIQFYGENASAIAGMLISHSGSNLQFSANQGTTNIQFIPSSYVEVLDGKAFRIRDATNSDLASWAHDGTDFNLVMTQTADYNISGITNLQVAANILSNGTAVSLAGHTHVEANITDLGDYLLKTGGTMTGNLVITTADPRLRYIESDAAVDNSTWEVFVNNEEYRIRLLNDSRSTGVNVFSLSRTLNVGNTANWVVDNLQHNGVDVALVKMTTDGDILYYNSGRQRLAKGSDLQVLTLASGIPSWANTTPMTTTGDILYYNSGLKRLAKGTDDKVLTMAGNLPTWQDPAGGGPNVTVSTSAASGGGTQGDLWCRI